MEARKNTKAKIKLLLLLLLFITPGLLAYFFYYYVPLHLTTTNHGVLLKPPVMITSDGLSKKWYLVLHSDYGCWDTCLQQLQDLNKVRISLGRRFYQVDILLLVDKGVVRTATKDFLAKNHVTLVTPSLGELKILHAEKGRDIYIMNQEHYLILAYKNTSTLDDIYQDLNRLLRKND